MRITIVYGTDRTITAYRNGRPYGAAYTANSLNTFPAGGAQLVFGLRHLPVGGNKMLAGSIRQAQLYDRASRPKRSRLWPALRRQFRWRRSRGAHAPENRASANNWSRSFRGSGCARLAVRRAGVCRQSPVARADARVRRTAIRRRPGDLVAPGGIAAAAPAEPIWGWLPIRPTPRGAKAGRLDHGSGGALAAARDGQPVVALSLWRGHRRHAQ